MRGPAKAAVMLVSLLMRKSRLVLWFSYYNLRDEKNSDNRSGRTSR